MLPTPSTSHVAFDTIYEPAEDSYLLLDTLSNATETAWLQSRLSQPHPTSTPTPLIVEIGTGSGVVIAFLTANAEIIFDRPVLGIGVDVNEAACRATTETVRKAITHQGGSGGSVYLGSVASDLGHVLRRREVDVLVFNPPYVPTEHVPALPALSGDNIFHGHEKFVVDSHLLSLSYAGGRDGLETTNRLLEHLPEMLSGRGVAYVLLCAQNRPEEVKRQIRDWEEHENGKRWHTETVGKSGKTAGWEKLEIVRIWQM